MLSHRILSVPDFSVHRTRCQQKFIFPGTDSIDLIAGGFEERKSGTIYVSLFSYFT